MAQEWSCCARSWPLPTGGAADATRLEREATSQAEAGHFRKAEELFARACGLDPGSARLHEAHAQCLLELDEAEAAHSAAARAVNASPAWPVAHATLGRAFLNAGRIEFAVERLAHAVQLAALSTNPKDAELVAELEPELKDAQALLERHWAEHHDVVVQLAFKGPPSLLRVRQSLDCRYCRLAGERGPGGAVWAAGAALAQVVARCRPDGELRAGDPAATPWHGVRVLELGSGTGIGGLAAAAAGADVLLTDRELLASVLQLNVELNASTVAAAAGRAAFAAFDWSTAPPACVMERGLDVVLAADLVYAFAAARPFAAALAAVLRGEAASKGIPALYAHNPRSQELDAEMHAALAAEGLAVHRLPMPQLEAVGHIGLPLLQRIVLLKIGLARSGQPDSTG